MRHRLTILALCLCFIPFSGAVGDADSLSAGPVIEETKTEYAKRLSAKANVLALEELARMSAAELVYRNQSKLYTTMSPVQDRPIGAYLKLYRDYKAYSIVDIYWSDSILAPISFEIRYIYDLIGTIPRPLLRETSKAVSEKDSIFQILGTYGLTRWYECDSDGNYLGNLSVLPDRPDYYSPGLQPTEDRAAASNPRPRITPEERSIYRGRGSATSH